MTVTFLSMKIEPENTGASQTVSAVTDETITINGTGYTHSLIVMPDMKPFSWPIRSFDELTLPDLMELGQYKPDIIVLGTGRQTRILRQEETFSLLEKGILIECMNNRAACGAYNLIVAENRHALLALIMEDTEEIKQEKKVTLSS